jgi:hypothetical protein
MLDGLYSDYGKLVIQAEILNAQIMQLKQKIAEELNKQRSENAGSIEKTDNC